MRKAEELLLKVLNEGDLKRIKSLNGIGPKRAQMIVDFRATNGAFAKISDIQGANLKMGVVATMLKGQLLAMDVKISEEATCE